MKSWVTQVIEDERNVLFSMLGKLHLSVSKPDPELLRTVLELVAEATETKVASDATSRNTLTKLQTSLLKLMHDIATTERGGEETILDETVMPETKSRVGADTTLHSEAGAEEQDVEAEEDEVTMQLQREMEMTTMEDPDAESTRIDDSVQEYDFSGMADDKDVQELLDSMADEDDEDLID